MKIGKCADMSKCLTCTDRVCRDENHATRHYRMVRDFLSAKLGEMEVISDRLHHTLKENFKLAEENERLKGEIEKWKKWGQYVMPGEYIKSGVLSIIMSDWRAVMFKDNAERDECFEFLLKYSVFRV